MSCYIVATGAALPERVVPNAELGPLLGVSPEWIESKCGIRERRWVGAGQSTSDLAAAAVEDALARAGEGAAVLDYLVGCTLSPDYQVPGVAPLVERKLAGCRGVPALDVRVGCAAILYELQLARGLLASGAAKVVGCFGAEAQSKGLDLSPRSADLSMLFGDGAGALLVSWEPLAGAPDVPLRVDDIVIGTDGTHAEDLAVRAPGTANGERWLDGEMLERGLQFGSFDGRSLILHAVRRMAEAAACVFERNGLGPNDVDLLVPHQANANLLRATARQVGIPSERVVTNVERLGNTSSASAFLALWQAQREGRIRAGMRVLVLAFGAGFTWGAALCTAEA